MPTNNRVGLDDDERIAPSLPDTRKPDPEHTIQPLQPRALGLTRENGNLMPQSDIFEDYFCSRREEDLEKSKKLSESEHRWPFTTEFGRKAQFRGDAWHRQGRFHRTGGDPVSSVFSTRTKFSVGTALLGTHCVLVLSPTPGIMKMGFAASGKAPFEKRIQKT